MHHALRAVIGLSVSLAVAAGVHAQTAPLEQFDAILHVDSGRVRNDTNERGVVFSTVAAAPDAAWLRLTFDKVTLGAVPPGGQETILRITSLHDGAVQTMNAMHLQQWNYTSAYFNGGVLLLEIIADPQADHSHLISTHAWAGEKEVNPANTRSICGPTDDRVLSEDPRAARLMPIGCSCWLFDDANHQFLTAGHCIDNGIGDVAEFNVPLSDPNGSVNHPGPEDQYAVDPVSVQGNGGQGMGDDWAYYGCFPNSTTGLTAYEAQGDYFTLDMPAQPQGEDIRITGYGTVSYPVSPTWNQVQKTHAGPYYGLVDTWVRYTTDTTGGNSGSPVINEASGHAIGIHTHGGCNSSGYNSGTGANHPDLQYALANPQGVCIPNPPIAFEYPDGLPEALDPDGTVVRVHVVDGNGGSPQPGTGQFAYRTGGSWITSPMIEISPNVYDAVFPAMDCGTQADFYFSAESTGGETVHDPVLAPNQYYTRFAVYGFDYALDEDFSTNPGWSTEDLWAFGQPTGQGGQYGYADPTGGYTGPNVYGYNLYGDYQNNLPERHLTTTVIDCSDLVTVTLKFQRWLGVEQPVYDHAYVRVSNNGTTWSTVWQNPSEITDSQWQTQEIDITNWAAGHSTVYLRWTMGTTDIGWQYCGWNIDDVQVYGFNCDSPCPADINGDGIVDVLDLLEVLAAWGPCTGCPADINGDDIVDVLDLLEILAAWGPCA